MTVENLYKTLKHYKYFLPNDVLDFLCKKMESEVEEVLHDPEYIDYAVNDWISKFKKLGTQKYELVHFLKVNENFIKDTNVENIFKSILTSTINKINDKYDLKLYFEKILEGEIYLSAPRLGQNSADDFLNKISDFYKDFTQRIETALNDSFPMFDYKVNLAPLNSKRLATSVRKISLKIGYGTYIIQK